MRSALRTLGQEHERHYRWERYAYCVDLAGDFFDGGRPPNVTALLAHQRTPEPPGARQRGEVALVFAVVGHADGDRPRNPLSSVDASVRLGDQPDAWPAPYERVMTADILVPAGPIWLGDNSSVTKRVIERLCSCSSLLNAEGQNAYYGRAGGCLITGDEDGVKHCAMNVLYSLQHLGCTVPPQADAGWIGAAGPGPSYPDPGSGSPENVFANRNTSFMSWNLMHLAALLHRAGGIPAHGNQRTEWDADCRPEAHRAVERGPLPRHRTCFRKHRSEASGGCAGAAGVVGVGLQRGDDRGHPAPQRQGAEHLLP